MEISRQFAPKPYEAVGLSAEDFSERPIGPGFSNNPTKRAYGNAKRKARDERQTLDAIDDPILKTYAIASRVTSRNPQGGALGMMKGGQARFLDAAAAERQNMEDTYDWRLDSDYQASLKHKWDTDRENMSSQEMQHFGEIIMHEGFMGPETKISKPDWEGPTSRPKLNSKGEPVYDGLSLTPQYEDIPESYTTLGELNSENQEKRRESKRRHTVYTRMVNESVAVNKSHKGNLSLP